MVLLRETQMEGKRVSRMKHVPMKPKPSLTFLEIMSEALKVVIRNGKLLLSIMLPVSVSSTLLSRAANSALKPIESDLYYKMDNLQRYPRSVAAEANLVGDIVGEFCRYMVLELLVFILSSSISLFLFLSTVSSSSEAYNGKPQSLRDVIMGIRGKWKKPIITSFFIFMIHLLPIFLLVSFIYFWYAQEMTSTGLSKDLLDLVMTILGAVWYLYLESLWVMSLVVSVLEEETSGLKAISRAGDLLRGKRLQGFALILIFSVVNIALKSSSSAMAKLTDKAIWVEAIWVYKALFFGPLQVFKFVVCTVFYHECKESEGKVWVEGELVDYACSEV